MRGAGPSPRQSPRTLRPDPGPAMSFFRRKVKGKEQEKTSDVKSIKGLFAWLFVQQSLL
uniref:A kinase anchor protein 10 isoform 4 n=1 Tax=Homo sapiens TaxID=9606 RepID=A0A0S2Z5A1_HUMAN|nr:A kinase anchor protein 10 isoform 4 [Homo sapiens]